MVFMLKQTVPETLVCIEVKYYSTLPKAIPFRRTVNLLCLQQGPSSRVKRARSTPLKQSVFHSNANILGFDRACGYQKVCHE